MVLNWLPAAIQKKEKESQEVRKERKKMVEDFAGAMNESSADGYEGREGGGAAMMKAEKAVAPP